MKIEFNVNPLEEIMNVKVSYCKEEICQEHFYLNRDFLVKYRDIPVDMELFCNEYIEFTQKSELRKFFEDWIYSTKGPQAFITQ